MAAFREFIRSIQADGNDGQAFEHFCKWFLLNDPYWKTQVDKAWLWDEWPERWGPDCGIDLIFKHKNGETWAVQAKCYDERHSASKADMDTFLTESNRAVIQHRLLLASTNGMSSNGERACWSCPAYVPVSQLIYAAFRSNAKGLFPPNDECRRLGL